MSKVQKIKDKYKITDSIFKKFVDSDNTQTNKYLEYMTRMWKNKETSNVGTVNDLIRQVLKFDELINYIPLKDIYHEEYGNFLFLVEMIRKAEELKEEKSFIREEHCDVLIENDNFILIRPKTFRGSLKYGSGTKWCTSSKTNSRTFETYYRSGVIVYLIDKTNTKTNSAEKIALYMDYKQSPLVGEVNMYNSKDETIDENFAIKNGWNEDDFWEIILSFRYFTYELKKQKISHEYVKNFEKTLKSINLNELEKHIKNIDPKFTMDTLKDFDNILNEFKNKIKNHGN
jgi:hypothetical protein